MNRPQALKTLEQVVPLLQKRDKYSKVLYTISWEYFIKRLNDQSLPHPWDCDQLNSDGTNGYLSFMDIIDDAYNCHYLLGDLTDQIIDLFRDEYNEMPQTSRTDF